MKEIEEWYDRAQQRKEFAEPCKGAILYSKGEGQNTCRFGWSQSVEGLWGWDKFPFILTLLLLYSFFKW
jgi:hypothetical protein